MYFCAFLFINQGIFEGIPQNFAIPADTETACFEVFNHSPLALLSEHVELKIESFDDLIRAFTQGFVPDLNNASQRDAFEIYRRLRFGDPDTILNSGSLDEIARILRRKPELEKEPFRNIILKIQQRTYPGQ